MLHGKSAAQKAEKTAKETFDQVWWLGGIFQKLKLKKKIKTRN